MGWNKYLNEFYKRTAVHLWAGSAEPFPASACRKAAASPGGLPSWGSGTEEVTSGVLQSLAPKARSGCRCQILTTLWKLWSSVESIKTWREKLEGARSLPHDTFHIFSFRLKCQLSFLLYHSILVNANEMYKKTQKHLQVWKKYFLITFSDLLQCKKGQN